MTKIETLLNHCGERYPHFESPRGQTDITEARKEQGALLALLSAYHDAAKYHCQDTHNIERANSQRATAMLGKCMQAHLQLNDGELVAATMLALEVLEELKGARTLVKGKAK